MENDILDSLNDIGYVGPLTDEDAFSKALEGGAKSLEFTKLIHILTAEIKQLCNLEETVNIINDPEESNSFLFELSSFLKELGCPYKKLVVGHLSSRLQSKEDRLLLLDYLLSELMAARMVNIDKPKDTNSSMEIVVHESPTARDLKDVLIALKFNKPPPNITAEMLFSKLETKLKDTIQKEGETLVGKPLYNKSMTEKQWKELEASYTEMLEEYRLRREMLISRLECTIQSFEWSDRLKTKKDQIQAAYRPKRAQFKVKPDVKLSDFLAARTSLLLVEKTSSASVRKNTQSEVNKVIIGRVPDRGGRPNEQQPPPPEMPSWQQRAQQKIPRSFQIIAYPGGMLTGVPSSCERTHIKTERITSTHENGPLEMDSVHSNDRKLPIAATPNTQETCKSFQEVNSLTRDENSRKRLNTTSIDAAIKESQENEFDVFCRSLAIQLKKMPLERALICQEKLQSVMVQERLSSMLLHSPIANNQSVGVFTAGSHSQVSDYSNQSSPPYPVSYE